MAMRRIFLASLLSLATIPAAHAMQDCSSNSLKPQPLPARPLLAAPVASEFSALNSQLGAPRGVLAHEFADAMSVDQVLLRTRIAKCQNVAIASPVRAVANPNDPAGYKPKTQFDNTPYRFNMTQNGKRMTADDFDAWLKANGYSAGKKAAPAAAPAPAVAPAPEPAKK
jgi:hypothetical protein